MSSDEPKRADKAHLRIPNRVYEAILDSGMTDRQKVICFALIRVTLGWQQKSATLTQEEFAEAAGIPFGGTFRAALGRLEAAGVILAYKVHKTAAKTYSLQLDYSRWGKFAVSPERLRRRFGTRFQPDDSGIDEAAHLRAMTDAREQAEYDARLRALDDMNEDDEEEDYASPRAELTPDTRRSLRLAPGEVTPPNPIETVALEPRKDIERQERQTTTANSKEPVALSPQAEFAQGITVAANTAALAKWGPIAEARPYFYGMSTDLAADLILEGVPLDIAQSAIAQQIQRSKLPKPPSTISYFRNGIIDAHRAVSQRSLDARTPLLPTANLPRGGAPTALAASLAPVPAYDSGKDRRDADLHAQYTADLDQAARSWAENPDNASAFASITDAAKSAAIFGLDSFVGQRAFAADVRARIAAVIRFPDFETWQAYKRSPKAGS